MHWADRVRDRCGLPTRNGAALPLAEVRADLRWHDKNPGHEKAVMGDRAFHLRQRRRHHPIVIRPEVIRRPARILVAARARRSAHGVARCNSPPETSADPPEPPQPSKIQFSPWAASA